MINDRHERYVDLAKRAEALDARMQQEMKRLEAHGVLDGEARLKLRDAAIEIARLKEQIRHFGEPDAEQHATDAADVAALNTQIDYWTAQIDREFKAGR